MQEGQVFMLPPLQNQPDNVDIQRQGAHSGQADDHGAEAGPVMVTHYDFFSKRSLFLGVSWSSARSAL